MEVDSKGRVLLPSKIRRQVKARRFTLKVSKGKIVLGPLPDPESVIGKHKGLLKVGLEELEEAQESFVAGGRR